MEPTFRTFNWHKRINPASTQQVVLSASGAEKPKSPLAIVGEIAPLLNAIEYDKVNRHKTLKDSPQGGTGCPFAQLIGNRLICLLQRLTQLATRYSYRTPFARSLKKTMPLNSQCETSKGEMSVKDAVQIACAVAEGLDAIVTRNPADFQTSLIPVMAIAEMLHQLNPATE